LRATTPYGDLDLDNSEYSGDDDPKELRNRDAQKVKAIEEQLSDNNQDFSNKDVYNKDSNNEDSRVKEL